MVSSASASARQKIEFLPEKPILGSPKMGSAQCLYDFFFLVPYSFSRNQRQQKRHIFGGKTSEEWPVLGFPRIGVPQNIQVSRSIEDLKHPL